LAKLIQISFAEISFPDFLPGSPASDSLIAEKDFKRKETSARKG
jgi:hypothetical protein